MRLNPATGQREELFHAEEFRGGIGEAESHETPLFARLKVRGLEVGRSAHPEVWVQAVAPADFSKAPEAFERLPSG